MTNNLPIDIDKEIDSLQEVLKLPLPISYLNFLRGNQRKLINRLPILGVPNTLDNSSTSGATKLLRTLRPDLPESLVAIRLMDIRVLCLDLREQREVDAPLVEIELNSSNSPKIVHSSFAQYIQESDKFERRRKLALASLRFHWKKHRFIPAKSRKDLDVTKGMHFPRSHQWKTLRSCVHDVIVGLTALRYNPSFNGLEVDVFISTDHSSYEGDHGLKALCMLVLSEAYKSSGSMRIQFRPDVNNGKVPDELVRLAKKLYNTDSNPFTRSDEGLITHEEASRLYSELVGLPSSVKAILQNLKEKFFLTPEGLSYLIASGIWTPDEVIWLLTNANRPEGILLGLDLPEDRLNYLESISFGRAVLAVSRLRQRIINDYEEESQKLLACDLNSSGVLFTLKGSKPFNLPYNGETKDIITIKPNHFLSILSRPRIFYEENQLLGDVLFLKETLAGTKILLVTSEISILPNIESIRLELKKQQISLIELPFGCDELDEEVAQRMMRSSTIRL